MSHMYIPTLPQIIPARRPKSHRAVLPTIIDPRVASGEADLPSQARCIATPGHVGICPRHNPADYADMMASHATDSL